MSIKNTIVIKNNKDYFIKDYKIKKILYPEQITKEDKIGILYNYPIKRNKLLIEIQKEYIDDGKIYYEEEIYTHISLPDYYQYVYESKDNEITIEKFYIGSLNEEKFSLELKQDLENYKDDIIENDCIDYNFKKNMLHYGDISVLTKEKQNYNQLNLKNNIFTDEFFIINSNITNLVNMSGNKFENGIYIFANEFKNFIFEENIIEKEFYMRENKFENICIQFNRFYKPFIMEELNIVCNEGCIMGNIFKDNVRIASRLVKGNEFKDLLIFRDNIYIKDFIFRKNNCNKLSFENESNNKSQSNFKFTNNTINGFYMYNCNFNKKVYILYNIIHEFISNQCIYMDKIDIYKNEFKSEIKKWEFKQNKCENNVVIRNNIWEEDVIFIENEFKNKLIFKKNKLNNLLSNSLQKDIFGNVEEFNRRYGFNSNHFIDDVIIIRNTFNNKIDFIKNKFYSDYFLTDNNYNQYIYYNKNKFKNKIFITKSYTDLNVIFNDDIINDGIYIKNIKSISDLYFGKITNSINLMILDSYLSSSIIIDEEKIRKLSIVNTIIEGIINVENLSDKGRNLIRKCEQNEKEFNALKQKYHKYLGKNVNINYVISETLKILKENYRKLDKYEEEDNLYFAYKKYDIIPIYEQKVEINESDNFKTKKYKIKNNRRIIYNNIHKKLKFMLLKVFEYIGGFGTKPFSIAVAMFILVIIFGGIYMFTGIQTQIPESKNAFITSIYFSGITFLTVGYGDISAWNLISSVLVCIEGFLGVFLISYFSFSIIRKINR